MEQVTESMTTPLPGACLPGQETDMSRRYLGIAQRWLPVAVSYFEDWPGRPDCGHFFGGVHWYGIETAIPLHALALVSTSPEYDERVTRLSLDELRRMVVKAIRYLCFTHDTGPAGCVRPSKGLGMPNTWGTKWGERGRGFFPESQCGGTIANMTTAALMLRPFVDEETWMMVARICQDYLERFGEMDPKSGVYADTQMEENAWTAHGLSTCYLFLSRHPDAGKWEQNARRWLFSACAAPQDRFNHGEIAPGVTVARLTGKTFTTLPDYMAENHGMIHPGYTASGVHSLGSEGAIHRLYGRVEPPEARWNRQAIYDVIKRLTDLSGSPMPVQGMDRLYLGERHGLHAVAHLFLKDPDAGAFERLALNLREKSLAGGDGRLIDLEIAKKCHEVEDPMEIKESEAIYGIAHPYAMHRMMDAEAPEPTPLDELMRKFDGVRVFPHSGFAFHRHARGQTSLSWRNHFIALPFPRDGVLTIGPSRASVLAQVTVKDRAPGQVLRALSIDRKDDGFAALMVVDRDQETVRQRVLFASLPNGDMLCDEGLTALARCTVERVQQGFLRIVNENYPAYEGNCNGYRILHHPDGKERFEGFPSLDPGDDISFDLSHPGWLNVDDRMGLVFRGSGATRYLNRHFYPPFSFRAVADDLFLSLSEDPKECRPDETVAELSLLACPGQPSGETPFRRLIRCVGSPDSVCLITEGFLLAGNFGSHRAACAFPVSREETVPLFPGVARLDGTRVEYTVRMEGEQAVYLEQIASIRCDGSVKVEAVAGGGLYLVNEGTRGVRAIVRREGREEPFDLPPGALRSA